jgi:hypothetical protein
LPLIKTLPLTCWQVGQNILIAFTGLEANASGVIVVRGQGIQPTATSYTSVAPIALGYVLVHA